MTLYRFFRKKEMTEVGNDIWDMDCFLEFKWDLFFDFLFGDGRISSLSGEKDCKIWTFLPKAYEGLGFKLTENSEIGISFIAFSDRTTQSSCN